MSMRFMFVALGEGDQQAPDLDGIGASLWRQVGGIATPVAYGALQDGEVEFGVVPLPEYAVVLQDDGVLARTGLREPADDELGDDPGDFTSYWALYRSEPVTVDEEELDDALPDVPLDAGDDLTITDLDLSVEADELVVSGSATAAVQIVGDVDVEFEYRFTLEPNTHPFAPDSLLRVVTQSVSLSGGGGLTGFVVNLILSLLPAAGGDPRGARARVHPAAARCRDRRHPRRGGAARGGHCHRRIGQRRPVDRARHRRRGGSSARRGVRGGVVGRFAARAPQERGRRLAPDSRRGAPRHAARRGVHPAAALPQP
jgi:hypothetical protein